MIRYKCDACMEDLEVESKMAGRAAECHKCKNVQTVPLPDFLPTLECPYCEEHTWGDLTEENAGTMIKCPKCNHMVRVPGASKGCSFTACLCLLVAVGISLLTYGLVR